MNKFTIFGAVIALGMLTAVPVFADGLAKTQAGTNTSMTNSSGGNGSNGSVGDNPNATATDDVCVRRTSSGNETKIVCPPNADGTVTTSK